MEKGQKKKKEESKCYSKTRACAKGCDSLTQFSKALKCFSHLCTGKHTFTELNTRLNEKGGRIERKTEGGGRKDRQKERKRKERIKNRGGLERSGPAGSWSP